MNIPAEFDGGVRKCRLRKWADFQGYGFNLHAEKGKFGQFIGQVDEKSPALAAGLRGGDRIVEVNDENIGTENHQQVVSRIRSSGDHVWFLVVDKETDKYCSDNGIVVSSSLPSVKVKECPESCDEVNWPSSEDQGEELQNGQANGEGEGDSAVADNDYESELTETSQTPVHPAPETVTEPEVPVSAVNEPEQEALPDPPPDPTPVTPSPAEPESTKAAEPEPPKTEEFPPKTTSEPQEQPSHTTKDPAVASMTKMSAAEMREALKQKKRADPRQQKLSAKDKLAMFQRL